MKNMARSIFGFKTKTPGFGISPLCYLTVLSSRASLPSIRQVVDPKVPEAVPGYGIPMSPDASREVLDRPLERGGYLISSPDKKTVLKMLVISKEECGFNPEPFLRSYQAIGMSREALNRISATWTLLQLTFETYDPMVYDSMRFAMRIAQRLGELTDGVISDPVAQTYKLPEHVFVAEPSDPRIEAQDVVHVSAHPRRDDPTVHTAHTLGLQKFGLAEIEISGFHLDEAEIAQSFLYSLAQMELLGQIMGIGDKVGGDACLLTVVVGGLDRGRWEGIPCFELLPPTGKSMTDALLAWVAEV